MAKTTKATETANANAKSIEQLKKDFAQANNDGFMTLGSNFPQIIKKEELDGKKDYALLPDIYTSEKLLKLKSKEKQEFLHLIDTETGEEVILNCYGDLMRQVNLIPEALRAQNPTVRIKYKGQIEKQGGEKINLFTLMFKPVQIETEN